MARRWFDQSYRGWYVTSNQAFPQVLWNAVTLGVGFMRLMHLCYAAFGFAVARWIFKREAVPVADPVARFRASGLM